MANKQVVVVGLGMTGKSVLDFYTGQDVSLMGVDTAVSAATLQHLKQIYPHVCFSTIYDEPILSKADTLVVSPGVDLRAPLFQRIADRGVEIVGDIELFARYAAAPIIAVTGSNGKTSVCVLCHRALQAAGCRVLLGGNVGVPALSLLSAPVPDYYVLELSSFQLETVHSLRDHVAVIINVSPDHLDRYDDFDDYVQAKKRVVRGAKMALVNHDQPELALDASVPQCSFSVCSNQTDYGVDVSGDAVWFTRQQKRWCDVSSACLQGRHHWQNALVVLIIADVLGVDVSRVLPEVLAFSGVDHRCQWVADRAGVRWFNDSKATNEGATVAAITALSCQGDQGLILIAGGDAKQSDLKQFAQVVINRVGHVIVLGQDREYIKALLNGRVKVSAVDNLRQAVETARQVAQSGDIVLLSPACSSLDMFDSYAQRAALFTEYVLGLSE